MKTKYYYGKPKDNRRIFADEPTWQENAVDCLAFACAIGAIFVILFMMGVRP